MRNSLLRSVLDAHSSWQHQNANCNYGDHGICDVHCFFIEFRWAPESQSHACRNDLHDPRDDRSMTDKAFLLWQSLRLSAENFYSCQIVYAIWILLFRFSYLARDRKSSFLFFSFILQYKWEWHKKTSLVSRQIQLRFWQRALITVLSAAIAAWWRCLNFLARLSAQPSQTSFDPGRKVVGSTCCEHDAMHKCFNTRMRVWYVWICVGVWTCVLTTVATSPVWFFYARQTNECGIVTRGHVVESPPTVWL